MGKCPGKGDRLTSLFSMPGLAIPYAADITTVRIVTHFVRLLLRTLLRKTVLGAAPLI